MDNSKPSLKSRLLEGLAIPALPLALDQGRGWSERYQRGLIRYYRDAGVGGIAVGVHSTQFAIRESRYGLFAPLLALAAETMDQQPGKGGRPLVKIAGICGLTRQAVQEAELAVSHGYEAGLLSLAALGGQEESALIEHCRVVSETIPVIGFYLQPAVGGRYFSEAFWRALAGLPGVVAIKIAPFNRYGTLDVVRAVVASGREDLALYTGNDDSIAVDLLTRFEVDGKDRWIVGGLLGQFGVWTERAVALFEELKRVRQTDSVAAEWLTRAAAWTDANGAVFDAANQFAGVIPGIHEVLRRQGLLPTNHCLDPEEVLSPGQAEALDRVTQAYPWLVDDAFVAEHLDRWLEG